MCFLFTQTHPRRIQIVCEAGERVRGRASRITNSHSPPHEEEIVRLIEHPGRHPKSSA